MTAEEIVVPNCKGCSNPIEEGAVVAFGDSLFHIKCFVCDKCKECVKNKTNLLLLDNGKPETKLITRIALNAYPGIYCTICYEARKASRKNKVKPGALSDLPQREPVKDPPTPARSRSNSSNTKVNNESLLSVLSPVTLSFFDNNSSELLDNLSNSLGANLSLNFDSSTESATQSRINRASEILLSSLRTSSLKQAIEARDSDVNHFDVNKLKQELSEARSNLKELESDYNLLQKASQQALDEFTKVKEEYAKEALIKQQQEFIITALLRKDSGLLSKKDLDRLAIFRSQLENACSELIKHRDTLVVEIDQAVDKQTLSTYYANYQKSLKAQLKSITQQRDLLYAETKDLRETRNELVHDLISLNNTKSEEPTDPPITISPSQSTSSIRPRKLSDADSVICKVSSRNSYLGDQTPTLFRIKKKGSTMFNKFTHSNNTNGTNVSNSKLKPEPSISSSSTSSTSASSSIYNLSSKFATGSLQNLSKKSGFMDSSLSLHGNHAFMPTSFIRPTKCGVCSDKIWGRSEYRCEGCGFLAHSRCLSQVPQSCLAAYASCSTNSFDLQSDSSSVFNHENKLLPQLPVSSASLVERVDFEGRIVPLLVEECIKAVEQRGLDYEGIYRKSGGAAQTRAIQLAFEQGDKADLCNEDEYNDVCAITSVLKQYFRELPNPLLTFECYQELIDISTMNNDEKKLEMATKALTRLPKAHKDTLNILLKHLNKVCESSSLNRMTTKNLSMVFAPTLMRHQDPSRDFLDISYKNAAVEYLLLHTSKLF
ncbi:hypothetical protein RO3G_08587 [Rhizopus delemar RA 99-880]|uniref:RhoGAP-domain-containing protein n=1 Tax=Rhizopus delemar (strain RA 99-880 / ATCC MYA-4621 / FGSC 9543 / NRRL 43880) TaxID=246409 RepID=I1C602_RHIO9|nr:hypothetical protein RO3G_08587 [Rhizopus delemar RA 99-880]|eukprot:EIE83882.1 hypothetical protein RO3G_08587 [Rhizopus delemar RA 99-880]